MAEKIKSYSAGFLAVTFFAVLLWFGSSLAGSSSYEVKPEISIPEYKSDTRRAIESNEKLMDRYINLTEHNMKTLAADNEKIIAKLTNIEADISQINKRLSRIEKSLGIDSPKPIDPETKAIKKFLEETTKKAAPKEEQL